tara:strand:+ start:8554 stop:8883 length:330 start_codon:yes stop_codon:yes gene_type:complete
MREEGKNREKLIYYLKLYTHLITAIEELGSRRGFDRLKIVSQLTRESHPGETHYIKYIHSLVRSVFSHKRRIKNILNKDPAADPLHAKTQLLTAQNICMLRILKLSSSA